RLLARILARAGFTAIHTTTRPRDVARLYEELNPDLIILDIRMPELDGFGVLAELRDRVSSTEYLPVLSITGDASPETRQKVLMAGAKDFLEKPFETSEVIVRVQNLLTTRVLHRSLQQQNARLEERVRERTAELEAALSAAESASRAKSQFLATMSHELRTPLNAVIGFSQHLRKNKAGNLQTQDLAFLERINDNGTHLLRVINDILDLSRIEAGKMLVEHTSVSLRAVIMETIAQIAAAPGGMRAEARMCIPYGVRPLLTDESKLRRILINLIGNAAKFTEKGLVQVAVRAADTRPMRIDVVDTGIGIPPERLAAIFERFEQADNSTQRKFGGTGLGLAISRTLCELLGFRIAVVSEAGVGSCFSILVDPSAAPPASYSEAASLTAESEVLCA
ncbi:MAG TPA: ATP-binding protein, partial [Gemmatimonadaceae bacterium]|nr:ATP-binding protein [Gemmatimonadaceae bacterium]